MLTPSQGESPYEDATDVLRKKMGCKRKGNHFTVHGQLHEPIALKEYKKGHLPTRFMATLCACFIVLPLLISRLITFMCFLLCVFACLFMRLMTITNI